MKLAIFDAHTSSNFPSFFPLCLRLNVVLLLQLPEPLKEFLERRAVLWITAYKKGYSFHWIGNRLFSTNVQTGMYLSQQLWIIDAH